MKGAKKHFSRALTLLLSVLIMLQTVTVPAFAAENTTENVEVATNDASTEEESTFNLINADVQIDDEYGNETDYISEVQIPDLEQISEETLVENGVSIHSDYPGDAIESLNPGAEETFRFSIGMDEFSNDVSGETKTYFFLVETEELESDRGNNSEFVYLHPDYDITLIAGSGGNVSGGGTYVKGNDAILIATPLSGYIFDGWYENGELLYGVSNEYEITVDSNRTLEARFKENDLQITDVEIFGTLAAGETISFTVSATGGVQPWQWEFYIQSDNEVVYSDNAAIVNFMEWTPSQSGTYDFLAFVTDATGKRMSYRTQFVVS